MRWLLQQDKKGQLLILVGEPGKCGDPTHPEGVSCLEFAKEAARATSLHQVQNERGDRTEVPSCPCCSHGLLSPRRSKSTREPRVDETSSI